MNRSLVYGQLAALCDEQEKLTESLQWYEKELNILEKLQSPTKAATHTGIGLVYHKQGKFNQARDQFNRTLQILKCITGDRNEYIAGCLFNIGRTYATKIPK
jgi:Tfp pilus assembly protein PilF